MTEMKKSEEKVTAKEEAVKTGAKVSEKAEEVKAPAVKKAAAPKKTAAKKETAKKETIKKTTTRKTAAKAAPAKAETPAAVAAPVETAPAAKAAVEAKPAKAPAKRTTRKAAEVKGNVTVQFAGKSYSTEDLVKIAKDVWKYDLGRDEADFKSVELYVKPEESSVYYVVNGDVTGSFNI